MRAGAFGFCPFRRYLLLGRVYFMRFEETLKVLAVNAKAAKQLDRLQLAELDVAANSEWADSQQFRNLVWRQIFTLNRHNAPALPCYALLHHYTF